MAKKNSDQQGDSGDQKSERPKCFIVMPISTPDEWLKRYGGDRDHFAHIQEHLFEPAIDAAGFDPVPPSAKGSDLIQAEIINNLDTADMVLCDMSTLNANVFFELGIRSALNKPACHVKDDLTERVPFDTTIINYYEYPHHIEVWDITREIECLSRHIRESRERSSGKNKLWALYGLEKSAETVAEGDPTGAKLELILQRIEGLERVASRTRPEMPGLSASAESDSVILGRARAIQMELEEIFREPVAMRSMLLRGSFAFVTKDSGVRIVTRPGRNSVVQFRAAPDVALVERVEKCLREITGNTSDIEVRISD